MKPGVFIGSSTESLDVAYAIQENLEHVAEATVWTQGIFELSRYSIDSLLDVLEGADFGAFVFSADDISMIRGKEKPSVRDNVVFELGLSVGCLGRERSFIVVARGAEDSLRFPTDLVGLTPALYDPARQDGNLRAALGPACSKLTKTIGRLGKRRPPEPAPSEGAPPQISYSEEDKKAILTSWMGSRPSSKNQQVIHFAQVDRELRLEPGTAKKYLKEVARKWRYVARHEGDQTILFEQQREGGSWLSR